MHYNLAPIRVSFKSCCTPKGGYLALFAPTRVVFLNKVDRTTIHPYKVDRTNIQPNKVDRTTV